MKHIHLLLFIFIASFANAQDEITAYFDSNWDKCKEENAVFYQKASKNDQKLWVVNDYYINGQLQMSAVYKKKNKKIRHGQFVSYYENGQKELEGEFIDDKGTGYFTYWFENGNIDSKGEFIDGKLEGVWCFYFQDGQMCAKEKYVDGERTEWGFWDKDGNNVDLKDAEYAPRFEGGLKMIYAILNHYIVYPEEARLQGAQGTVHLQFWVLENGKIDDVRVVEPFPPHTSLAEEALRVVKQLPDLIPGKQHNRPGKIRYNLPIRFTFSN